MRYFLGTDNLGRDVLSRIIVGARTSFIVALAALAFGSVLGSLIGLASGYLGGRLDAFVMRTADGMMAFPLVLAALLLVAVIGPGVLTVVIAASFVLWARFARLIRSEVLSVNERDFVTLARIAGASSRRIMLVHILPNVLNSVVVLLTLQLGFVIIVEATLSFLGAGVPPPTPTWGQMVANGRTYIETAWWISVFPGWRSRSWSYRSTCSETGCATTSIRGCGSFKEHNRGSRGIGRRFVSQRSNPCRLRKTRQAELDRVISQGPRRPPQRS